MLVTRLSSFVLVSWVAAFLMAQGPVKQPEFKIVPIGLQVEVSCSTTKIRTPIAQISWKPSEETLQAQRLDVTIYKDGFGTGAYATVSSLRPDQKFVLSQTGKQAALHPPGLDLVVNQVKTSKQTRSRGVVVEGLEPGLNYFWRVVTETKGLSVSSEVVRRQAPVCPADVREEQPKPKGN